MPCVFYVGLKSADEGAMKKPSISQDYFGENNCSTEIVTR